jgi:phage-related protein
MLFTLTRPLRWVGSAKKDLAAMPADVQDTFGYALHLAQAGGKHSQAKPLRGWGGAGVLEVMEDHHGDTYRAVYTVRYAMAVYVLHCFQKKSASGIATPKPDTALIQARLKAVTALEQGIKQGVKN